MNPVDKQEKNSEMDLKIPIQPNIRSMRLYKTYQGTGIKTTQVRDIAILPIVKTNAEVISFIKAVFGNTTYSSTVKKYYLPKRFLFANPYISGKRIYETIPFNELSRYVKTNLTKLASNPTYVIGNNNGDCVFDFSNIFEVIIRDDQKFRHIPKYVNNADLWFVKNMDYFIAPRYGLENDYLKNLQILNFHPILASGYHHVIFGIPVKTKHVTKIFTYMQNGTAATLSVKRDPDYDLISLLRFLVLVFDPEKISEKANPMVKDLAESWQKEELSFVFYNEKNFFYLNFRDLARWGIKTSNDFRKKILARILLLVRQNITDSESVEENDSDESTIDNHSELTKEEISKDQLNNETPVYSKEVEDIEEQEQISDILEKKDDEKKEEVDLEENNSDTQLDSDDKLEKQLSSLEKNSKSKKISKSKDDEDSIDARNMSYIESESEDVGGQNDKTDEETSEEDDEQNNSETFGNNTDQKTVKQRIVNLNSIIKPKLSKAQLSRIEISKEKYKSIMFDDKRTLQEILEDTKATTIESSIPKIKLRDESLKHSSLGDFEKSYVKNTMHKDIISVVHSFSNNKALNMHIAGFSKEKNIDQFNEKEVYEFELVDELGKKHKLKFNIPLIDKNGFMKINGDTKILKKQWLMLPVVKVKNDTVLISSNFNKVFLFRQGTILNHNLAIVNKIFRFYLTRINGCKIDFGNNTRENLDFITSVEYDELARKFHRITVSTKTLNLVIYFNQKEIRKDIENLKEMNILKYNTSIDKLPIAILKTQDNKAVVVDSNINNKDDSVCKDIISLIGNTGIITDFVATMGKIPAPKRRIYTRMMLQSKNVPLILFLSYLFGFKSVIEKINNNSIHFSDKREKGNLSPFVKFKDKYLYYPQYPLETSLLFNGLTQMDTEEYEAEDFETITPYMDYVYSRYGTRNILKGWSSFKELFLDPITVEVLRDYKMPTDFLELFLYANDLLGDNKHSHESDASLYRLRGYEIIAKELYSALADQYISLKQKGFKRETFTIYNDEVVKRLHKSTILENYDMLNPINELKAKGDATFKGPGGINSKDAFPLDKRGFGENMVGIVGLSVPENESVGIVKQLTMNPLLSSTRGYFHPINSREDIKKLNFSNIATAAEATIPYINLHDDAKRVGYSSSQIKHVVSVIDSSTPLVGTGYEKTIVHKIGDIYAFKAKDDGKVISIDVEKGMCILEYKSGAFDTVEFGNLMNRNSNMFLSNPMDINVTVGQKISKGDVISYNREFFAKRGSHIILKQGPMCHAVVLEGEATEEDASDITESFAERMATDVIKRKQISIGSKTNIISFKSIGDEVLYGDPLMIFEDSADSSGETTDILKVLGEVDEKTLSSIVRHIPKASETGIIKDIKVYWTTSMDNMSDSCREFVNAYIKREKKLIAHEESFTSSTSKRRLNIEKSEPYMDRIRGVEVDRDEGSLVIEYFIGGYHAMGPGDKLSYYSALKSIVSNVIPKELEPKTTYGDGRVDAIIGTKNIAARMIQSIYFSGLLGKIIYNQARNIKEDFFNEEELID